MTPDIDITEPLGQRRLREARERLAIMQAQDTETVSGHSIQPGDWIHSLDEGGISIVRSTSIYGSASVVLYRGDEIQVDQAMLDASKDRFGNLTWPALVGDANGQIEKWGSVRLRAGRAPRDLAPWVHGSTLWVEAREIARKAAWAEPNPERRAHALRRVQEVYGAGPVTSVITSVIKADRAFEEQQARISESAATGVSNIGPSRAGA
ncbi:hypothetical protein [Microbacterium sp. P05]|uniref:hypothetical protein n=1 Tax=Microbacterium sp. P05 TaxID=3366948 RepID=UPI00374602F0